MADERLWERVAASTGIAFVVLGVIGLAIGGQPPLPGDPAEEIQSFFLDNRSNLLAQTYLFGASGVFFFWFLGSLRSALRRAEGGTGRLSAVVFGTGLVLGALFIAGQSFTGALALNVAGAASPGVSVAFYSVATQLFSVSAFAVVVVGLAGAIVIIRSGGLPAWLGWLGGLVAAFGVLGGLGIFVEDGPLAPGQALSYVGFGLFFLWFLLLSIVLTQQGGAPSRARVSVARTRTPARKRATPGRARSTPARRKR